MIEWLKGIRRRRLEVQMSSVQAEISILTAILEQHATAALLRDLIRSTKLKAEIAKKLEHLITSK